MRTWVPELARVPQQRVHEPWLMSRAEQEQAGCRIPVRSPPHCWSHVAAVCCPVRLSINPIICSRERSRRASMHCAAAVAKAKQWAQVWTVPNLQLRIVLVPQPRVSSAGSTKPCPTATCCRAC